MKILFICGSLEPGRDGVGDYVRILAAEIIKEGHQVSCVSLNDNFLQKSEIAVQSCDNVSISVLRLPSFAKSGYHYSAIEKWIYDFDPEVISLQYVPFAFHKRGLPFWLSKFLKKIGSNRNWHIMFHELWVGMNPDASLKLIAWGLLQKKMIYSLIKNLNPILIHTQTKFYQSKLNDFGFRVNHLPLFSNVPVIGIQKNNNFNIPPKVISFVLFAHIHPGAPIHEFIEEVSIFSKSNQVPISLTIIGRCGQEKNAWELLWKNFGLELRSLGEQPLESISEVLSNSWFGISTTPLMQIEKSGSVAAMREHGLPILCVAKPWNHRSENRYKESNDIMEYKPGNLNNILDRFLMKRSESKGISNASNQVAATLLSTIQSYRFFN